MVDGHTGACQVLQVLGVVLVAEDMGRAADLEGGADAVGPDELLGVAEARGQTHAVQVAVELAVAGEPAEHQSRRVGEDDAHRLALQLLLQASKHRLGAPAEPGVEVGVCLERHVDLVCRHLQVVGPSPGRKDRVADGPRLRRLVCQEALPAGRHGLLGRR